MISTREPRKLVNQNIPLLIKELQNSGATVFAFTALNTSIVPDVGYIPTWRTNELKNLGISFDTNPTFPKKE